MTTDWTPARVESAIEECARRIADGVLKSDKAYRAFLKADHVYDIAVAEARLGAEGSIQDRKDKAELATIEQRRARDECDAVYKLMDRNMRSIQSELDSLRSIGTSVRQAYAVAGRGEN